MIKGKEGGVSYVSINLAVMLISIPLYVVANIYNYGANKRSTPPKTSLNYVHPSLTELGRTQEHMYRVEEMRRNREKSIR